MQCGRFGSGPRVWLGDDADGDQTPSAMFRIHRDGSVGLASAAMADPLPIWSLSRAVNANQSRSLDSQPSSRAGIRVVLWRWRNDDASPLVFAPYIFDPLRAIVASSRPALEIVSAT